MTHPTRTALLLAAVLAATGIAGPARAGPGPGRDAALEVRESAAVGISLRQAVRKVRRLTGGRVLSAGMGEVGGNPVYRIKVLMPGGRVRVVLVDARTGEILD